MADIAKEKWSVVYYEDRKGNVPVKEFVLELTETSRATMFRDFDLLEELGILAGAPLVRPITGIKKLWELRSKTKDGAVRIFYITHTVKQFVLLHGFIKKSAKTPKNDLDLAEKRLKDFLEREKTRNVDT